MSFDLGLYCSLSRLWAESFAIDAGTVCAHDIFCRDLVRKMINKKRRGQSLKNHLSIVLPDIDMPSTQDLGVEVAFVFFKDNTGISLLVGIEWVYTRGLCED